MHSKPVGHAIERNQLVNFKARPHQRPFRAIDEDLRNQGPGIVGASLHRPVSPRRHDGEQCATGRFHHVAVYGEEIAAFANRTNDVGADAAGG